MRSLRDATLSLRLAYLALLLVLALLCCSRPVVGESSGLPPLQTPVPSLTAQTFEELVHSGRPALVEFFAPWCGHCKAMAPLYEEAATRIAQQQETHKDDQPPLTQLAKVDCPVERDLCARFGITAFPVVKLIRYAEGAGKGSPLHVRDYSLPRTTDSFVAFAAGGWVSVPATFFPELDAQQQQHPQQAAPQQPQQQEQASQPPAAKASPPADAAAAAAAVAAPTPSSPAAAESQSAATPESVAAVAGGPAAPAADAAAGGDAPAAEPAAAAVPVISSDIPQQQPQQPTSLMNRLAAVRARAAAAATRAAAAAEELAQAEAEAKAVAAAAAASDAKTSPAAGATPVAADGVASPAASSVDPSDKRSDPSPSPAVSADAPPRSSNLWLILTIFGVLFGVGGVLLKKHWKELRRRYNRHQSLQLGKGV